MKGETLDLTRRLRLLAEALPPDGCVTFSRSDLERLTGDRPEEEEAAETAIADLTVKALAEELGKAESTVRGWAPRIPGGYQLGREWRFPRAAIRKWLDSQAEEKAQPETRGGPVNLSTWRNHMKGTG